MRSTMIVANTAEASKPSRRASSHGRSTSPARAGRMNDAAKPIVVAPQRHREPRRAERRQHDLPAHGAQHVAEEDADDADGDERGIGRAHDVPDATQIGVPQEHPNQHDGQPEQGDVSEPRAHDEQQCVAGPSPRDSRDLQPARQYYMRSRPRLREALASPSSNDYDARSRDAENAETIVPLATPLITSDLPGFARVRQGKVRDLYEVGDDLLIVATDRISAFDYVLGSGIPDKGRVLTQLSAFWFGRTAGIVPNHLRSAAVDAFPAALAPHREQLRGRAMLVRKTTPLPVECVARGYLSGSGWKDYVATGCGVRHSTAGRTARVGPSARSRSSRRPPRPTVGTT